MIVQEKITTRVYNTKIKTFGPPIIITKNKFSIESVIKNNFFPFSIFKLGKNFLIIENLFPQFSQFPINEGWNKVPNMLNKRRITYIKIFPTSSWSISLLDTKYKNIFKDLPKIKVWVRM